MCSCFEERERMCGVFTAWLAASLMDNSFNSNNRLRLREKNHILELSETRRLPLHSMFIITVRSSLHSFAAQSFQKAARQSGEETLQSGRG